MKALYAIAFAGAIVSTQAQTTISTTNNFSFSPTPATVELGESVNFMINSPHTATQVSQETWMANDSDPLSGGFNFSSGNHTYTPTEVGVIYYVCQPHVSSGMKGIIIVENTTGIDENSSSELFRLFPNPVANELIVEIAGSNELVLIDVQGREVMRRVVNANERLDVGQLPEGNYTALLMNEGATISTQRLTIAR